MTDQVETKSITFGGIFYSLCGVFVYSFIGGFLLFFLFLAIRFYSPVFVLLSPLSPITIFMLYFVLPYGFLWKHWRLSRPFGPGSFVICLITLLPVLKEFNEGRCFSENVFCAIVLFCLVIVSLIHVAESVSITLRWKLVLLLVIFEASLLMYSGVVYIRDTIEAKTFLREARQLYICSEDCQESYLIPEKTTRELLAHCRFLSVRPPLNKGSYTGKAKMTNGNEKNLRIAVGMGYFYVDGISFLFDFDDDVKEKTYQNFNDANNYFYEVEKKKRSK